jgi:5-formyltetrahydrofolate cyclo-ligase
VGKIMQFHRVNEEGICQKNDYKIQEWVTDSPCAASMLDIVFTPLLGFDRKGHRLGQGGGYYDATFEFLKQKSHPYLIGVAYECQQLDEIVCNEWDIDLHGVITEQCFYSMKPLKNSL